VNADSLGKNRTRNDCTLRQPAEIEAKLSDICNGKGIPHFSAGLSPVQRHLDLKSMKGQGEEVAEPILERIIKPTW
jgi:hypothetical protein